MKTTLPDTPGNQDEGETLGGGNDLISNLGCSREQWLTLWDEIKPGSQTKGRAADAVALQTVERRR